MASDAQKQKIRERRLQQIKEKEEKLNVIKEAIKEQKAKVDYNVMKEQLTHEELEKFHKPAVEAMTEGLERLQEMTHDKLLSAIEQVKHHPVAEGSLHPLPLIEGPPKKELKILPDKDLDKELVKHFKFPLPSEIIQQVQAGEIELENINDYIDALKSEALSTQRHYIGKNRQFINNKESEEYKRYDRIIKGLSGYMKRLKEYPSFLVLKGSGWKMKKDPLLLQANYKYYSSPDELISRLNLLIAGKQAGNNSVQLRNEIVEILDELLKAKILTNEQHSSFYKFINE